MSDTTRIDGYGASIEFDGQNITLIGGKMQATAWGTDTVRIPVNDVTKLSYRAASMMVNGEFRFRTVDPANTYAVPSKPGKGTHVEQNGLVIHWRKKDQAAFGALYDQLSSLVPA